MVPSAPTPRARARGHPWLPMDRRERTLGKWSPNWEGSFQVIQAFSNNAYEIEELVVDKRILRINGKYLKRYKSMLQEFRITKE